MADADEKTRISIKIGLDEIESEQAVLENSAAKNSAAKNSAPKNSAPENSASESSAPESSAQALAKPRAKKDADHKNLLGQLIEGKYQVISLLGSGGMSSVFLVKHMLLNKVRAMKIIHPHLAQDKEAIERFKREAEATSRLSHPNVVMVHEFGVYDGSPYIVMDYVEGITLADLIKSEKQGLSTERTLHIISQSCEALAHAHKSGVIHRDIKPSNIMLVNNDEEKDFVKLVDFGIAQLLAEDESIAKLTQTGQIFGTPLYMSPEQCQGQKLDEGADIYSLGCVMYEAIAGKTPFLGSNVYETIFKQINENPENLDGVVKEKNLKDALESIVFTAIAKDRSQRFQSMLEMKSELEQLRLGLAESSSAKLKKLGRQWQLKQAPRKIAKALSSKTAKISLSLACISGLALLGWQLPQNFNPPESRWKELDLSGQQEFDRARYGAARQSFGESLNIARKLKSNKMMLASLNEILDLERASGNKNQEANVLKEILAQKESYAFIDQLKQELNQEQKKLEKSGLKAMSAVEQASLRQFCGNAIDTAVSIAEDRGSEPARELLLRAKALIETAFGPDDQLMVRAVHNLGIFAHDRADYKEAISQYEAALALERKILAPHDSMTARTLLCLARASLQSGKDFQSCQQVLNQALEANRRAFGIESKQVVICRYLLASLYYREGKINEAKRELKTAISLCERIKDSDKELAAAYALNGLIEKDQKQLAKALLMLEESQEKDYQALFGVLLNSAELSIASNPEQAHSYLKRARAISQRFDQSKKNLSYELRYLEARILEQKGETQAALAGYADALKQLENLHADNSTQLLPLLSAYAKLAAESGNAKLAEAQYKRAFGLLASEPESAVSKHSQGYPLFLNYVRFLNKEGRKADAEELAGKWRQLSGN